MKKGQSKREFTVATSSGLRNYGSRRTGMRQICREFDKAYDDVFCAKRPWLKRPDLGLLPPSTFNGKRQTTPTALAAAYLALPSPEPGVLKRMCADNGCSYGSVAMLLFRMRKAKRDAAAAAAPLASALAPVHVRNSAAQTAA